VNLEAAQALAFTYLSRRERTTEEVCRHLLARGADEQLATAVVVELTEQGYLDDERFARLFAQDRRELGGWGTGRIRRALLERGVDREVAESALQDAQAGPGAGTDTGALRDAAARELERAVAVLRSRFADLQDTPRARKQALGVLLRKGYDYELAVDALGEHLRQVANAIAPPSPQY
jgi:regulatory protein